MSFTFGNNLRVTLFGQSHAQEVGCVIEGIAPGFRIDTEELASFMKRRQGGSRFGTPRREEDAPSFIAGIGPDGTVCEAPLVATLPNKNVDSEPYRKTRHIPRPSHADYISYVAFNQHEDWCGGGSFSARLTAGLCIAGAIAKQMLRKRGIEVDAHLLQVGSVRDERFVAGVAAAANEADAMHADMSRDAEGAVAHSVRNPHLQVQLKTLRSADFPCINAGSAHEMQELIDEVRAQGDSIGASVECIVTGVPLGLGEAFFDGVDAQLARGMFSLPAVKSFEMGAGTRSVELMGSQYNDPMRYVEGKPQITTNNSGGTLGGLTTGNPIVFTTGFKPTPTIAKPQKTINLETQENVTYTFEGRHDPCVGVRATPVVEAMANIIILDNLIEHDKHAHTLNDGACNHAE